MLISSTSAIINGMPCPPRPSSSGIGTRRRKTPSSRILISTQSPFIVQLTLISRLLV